MSYDPPPAAVVRVLDRYAAAGMHKAFAQEPPLWGGSCQMFKERKPGTSIRFADRNNFIEFEARPCHPAPATLHARAACSSIFSAQVCTGLHRSAGCDCAMLGHRVRHDSRMPDPASHQSAASLHHSHTETS